MPLVTGSKDEGPVPDKFIPALQPKSTNTANKKRSFDDLNKRGKPVSDEANAKRLDVPIVARNVASLRKPWDVEGEYRITDVHVLAPKGGQLSIKGFTFKFFCSKGSEDVSQWYAEFKFGEVRGIMKMCPSTSPESRSKQLLKLAEFEQACLLAKDLTPGPANTRWLMRWRGKAGGMMFEKRVGGEMDRSYGWDFERDRASSTDDFPGIKTTFMFECHGNVMRFEATKTTNLKEQSCSPSVLKAKWDGLWNPDWEVSEEDDFDLSEPPVPVDLGKPALTQSKQVSSGLERGVRKRTFPKRIVSIPVRAAGKVVF